MKKHYIFCRKKMLQFFLSPTNEKLWKNDIFTARSFYWFSHIGFLVFCDISAYDSMYVVDDDFTCRFYSFVFFLGSRKKVYEFESKNEVRFSLIFEFLKKGWGDFERNNLEGDDKNAQTESSSSRRR